MANRSVAASIGQSNIRPLSPNELTSLGLDEERRLYLDGKRVRTGVALSFWQKVGTVIVAASLLVTGVWDLLDILARFGF